MLNEATRRSLWTAYSAILIANRMMGQGRHVDMLYREPQCQIGSIFLTAKHQQAVTLIASHEIKLPPRPLVMRHTRSAV